jgi:hypothetical protein
MKNSVLPILLLASIFSSAAFAEQKTGQQTNPPPQSRSDSDHKYCYDVCDMQNGLCVRRETICK